MYRNVEIRKEISPDTSVVAIVKGDELPDWLVITKTEQEYARRRIADGEEIIVINSYFKLSIIIPEKEFPDPGRKYEELRRRSARVKAILKEHKQNEITVFSAYDTSSALAFTEGLVLSTYEFKKVSRKSKSESKKSYPENIFLYGDFNADELRWLNAVARGVYFARDLVNEPNNYLNAEDFAGIVSRHASRLGVKVDIYGKKKIEALRMGGIMAVNKGSEEPPTLSILEWKPDKPVNKKPLVLVGKGVMFDTGGINLKPGSYLDDMKADMAGGAVVASVLSVIAEAAINVHVIGLIPASDNRPGGKAIVPGDIISMYDGTLVEIINTDAEGRLILADALSFADNYDPQLLITVATLTGSAENAFSNQALAAMTNADREIFQLLVESGNAVYERLAEMPFFEEYGEMIKSDIADIKNLGDKKAGAITAGKFLEHFAGSPLIHLDIAGCSISRKDEYYRPAGGTGTGVRLLSEFIKRMAANKKKSKKEK